MRKHRALPGLAFALTLGLPGIALAGGEEEASTAQRELGAISVEIGSVQSVVQKARAEQLSVEQRLAGGEMLYRAKQYERAIVVFSEILEGFPNTPSYVDALWLRGETFYAGGEYLSARRDYRAIVDRGTEPRYAPYAPKALARLVDVCIRLGDVAGLDEVLAKMAQIAPSMSDPALQYAKGKALYLKKDYGGATSALSQVPLGTTLSHQARYFEALVVMRQAQASAGPASPDRPAHANYKPALDAFRRVTELQPDTSEHRHVIDLAWMAIGRLAYESESFQLASEAYSKVGRESPEFAEMLYELAWVYVRMGDVQRAERALEVLAIADPDSPNLADGALLRADLLLRAGAFEKALSLYEGTRATYDPMRERVENFLGSTSDVSVYYDRLSKQELDALDSSEALPPIAIKWAREGEDGPLAFAVIGDINLCRKLIRESELLVEKLTALVRAPNRVRAFPELLAGQEQAVGLLNRVSLARRTMAKGLDEEEPGNLSGEIGQVRAKRRELMGALDGLPTTSGEFADRDALGMRQWNAVSQELSRITIATDQLQAVVNGLRRMLKEDAQRGVVRDPASLQKLNEEIDASERELKGYREQELALRRLIDIGRAQVGLGDARYQADAKARADFREVLEREVQLAAAGQAGSSAQAYANRILPLLTQARAEEDQLVAAFMQLEAEVSKKAAELQQKIDAESANIASYKVQLETLDAEAHDVVGHIAQRNLGVVKDKLKGIVLRADVGITEQAWEVREEELERVRSLQNERARQQQLLDEEMREVLDDSMEPGAPAPAKPAN